MLQELASLQVNIQKYFFSLKLNNTEKIQQTLLQKPDEDLYIVNLIAEGAC